MLRKLLVANRGEIALRISRGAADLGLETVAIHSEDDSSSPHLRLADHVVALPGHGPRAYLDAETIVRAALDAGCDGVHPGYGFLSENADFARRCEEAGLIFVGPTPEQLELFGNKPAARRAATAAGVPVLRGIDHPISLAEVEEFRETLGADRPVLLKAVAGGGGRGTRVLDGNDSAALYEQCRSEALGSFGLPDLYVEEFLPRARHIEVQVVGDGRGELVHLGDRECSVQRRFQKLIEIAPAPALDSDLRAELLEAAVRLASSVDYRNAGTFEFLVEVADTGELGRFVFIEVNARLQVEHTVTEAVTGVDLVQTQLRIASGERLPDLGLEGSIPLRGHAIQARVNLETMGADGNVLPSAGLIEVYEPPSGPGVRIDGFGRSGYRTSTAFDSLLAKVIVHSPSPDFADAVSRTARALSDFRLVGVGSNLAFLRAVIAHDDFVDGLVHTRWIEEHVHDLVAAANTDAAAADDDETPAPRVERTNSQDPLGLFEHDARVKENERARSRSEGEAPPAPEGTVALTSPIQGTVVSVDVAIGDQVPAGTPVAVIEAMKMEHVIRAEQAGIVERVVHQTGDIVLAGHPIMLLRPAEVSGCGPEAASEIDPDHIRPDLREVLDRHDLTLDENRLAAVEKRRDRGYRMPRENIAELVDEGSFQEYWPLIVAQQHQRHDMETLLRETPADGLIAGIGSINGDLFDDDRSRAMVVSYDYTVLAGTQGSRNHYKQDRMYDLARRYRLPLVLFGEGGGGRPGDDRTGPRVAFDTHTFTQFSSLSGLVPLVAVVNGRTFAGNTALVACSDVIIATEGSTLAMGGPAMIEGGGLGIYTPEEVGPMEFQVPNGVVDLLVPDEAAAVGAAKKYLSYFQGSIDTWESSDQRRLRHVVPENRLRLYNMREIIDTLADDGSVLELRREFGVGVITAFIRIEGRPMGVIANNPHHLAGAIDSDGADKGARFLQLCDAFDIPVLSLMDCPGIMVGPDHERTALVRHAVRMFNAGANLTVPLFGVVVRKAYGLGVQAMCGASSLVGFFTVAWPTAEFAGMNIEGSVKLGYRKELAAIEDPEERKAEFDARVARAYENAKAVNASVGGGIDDVIDPAETRTWIANSLRRLPPVPARTDKKYPYIDTW